VDDNALSATEFHRHEKHNETQTTVHVQFNDITQPQNNVK